MIVFISIIIVFLVLFFLAYNFISTNHLDQLKLVQDDFDKVAEQYARFNAESKKLKAELLALEQQINFKKNDIKHSKALAAAQAIPEPETSKDDRISNHMVSQGIITIEQHEKAKAMQTKLQMDFVTICMTMGFISEKDAADLKKTTL
ncbi:MAG: hypothetical protein KKC99_07015 [Proteobacteria bacterium]|nr:hypothetical protein [Pseudomonadota bacterium]